MLCVSGSSRYLLEEACHDIRSLGAHRSVRSTKSNLKASTGKLFKAAGLTLKPSKLQFGSKQVNYCISLLGQMTCMICMIYFHLMI